MQRIHALQVALKDRPKIFQAVVLCLFFLSLLTLIFCGIQALQGDNKTANGTAQKAAKPPASQPSYASFSTIKR